MTETTDSAGIELVPALGEIWTLTHITPGIRGKVCAWVKARYRAELQAQRREKVDGVPVLSDEDYKESLALFNERAMAGDFKWGTPHEPNYMGSAIRTAITKGDSEANLYLTQLLLEPAHGPVSMARVMELYKDAGAELAEAVGRCIDPNRRALADAEKPAPTETKGTEKTTAA